MQQGITFQVAGSDGARRDRGAALVRERVQRDPPAGVRSADDLVLGHDDVVEVHLAELGVARQLLERADLDARRAHVGDQVGDALMGRRALVGSREHRAPARVLRP